MIHCPSCGEAQPEELSFCDQCGVRLGSSGLLMLGPSLGSELPSPAAAEEGEGEGPSSVMHPVPPPRDADSQRFVPIASWPALRASQ